ncbi:MAG: hypothetical protein LBN32_01330, partial [Helicobacteraceae bacterium]|nr:hypothetical protein [Helicobacteraceae bacterium]
MKVLFFAVLLTTFLLNGCGSQGGDNEDNSVKGVWWWHCNLITDDRYLDFAVDNNINEIYLSIRYPANADEFIEKAHAKGVKVFWLIGDYRYVNDDTELFDILERFKTYQATAPLNRRFAGVHLDIEPNQHHDFTTRRQELLKKYLALIIRVSDTMPIDIDIPASFDDLVAYKGQNMPLYKALISEA